MKNIEIGRNLILFNLLKDNLSFEIVSHKMNEINNKLFFKLKNELQFELNVELISDLAIK